MAYPEEPGINMLVLGEKNLHKRYFIESFKKILKHKSYEEYLKTEYREESETNDTFYAQYRKISFIDTPEVDPNTSLLENKAILNSIKLSIHTSRELHGIICLLHYDPKYYENYLLLIFTHLFTKKHLPAIKHKLMFVFVDTSDILEPVHVGFKKFLKSFGTDFSSSSWKDWRIQRWFDVDYTKLNEEEKNIKWRKSVLFFQGIFDYFIRDEMPRTIQFELRDADESVSKVLENFLDILFELAFTIENNLLASKSLGFLRRSFLKVESYNKYVTNCPVPLCSFTRIDTGEAVAASPNSQKCVSNVYTDKFCNKCKYSTSKHYTASYKIVTSNPSSSGVKSYYSLEEDRIFVIGSIAAIIALDRDKKLGKAFKNRVTDRIDEKQLDKDIKNKLSLLYEEVTKCSIKKNLSFNDILKYIDSAVGKHLVSVDYRNTFLRPEKSLILSSYCEGNESDEWNYFLEEEKHLQKKL